LRERNSVMRLVASVIALSLALVPFRAAAGGTAPAPKPCSSPENSQFDFWLGDWDASWPAAAGSPAGTGTNRIEKILDGCVVEEHFAAAGPSPLVGRSHSVFVPKAGRWKQTWVDNQGGYLDFTGGMQGSEMILAREAKGPDGKLRLQRMVFLNIAKESFDWRWEVSADGGATWNLVWPIHYVRRPADVPSGGAAAPASACAARPESRQFDFWLGEWEVRISPGRKDAGTVVATSREESAAEGCLLVENYAQNDGYTGRSLNFWDPALGKWRQTWVDRRGAVSEFTGEFRDGVMRFEGESHTPAGGRVLRKLYFQALGPDTVRQWSEASKDGGKTWVLFYDFTYVRKKS
jgi:hypothetical protein